MVEALSRIFSWAALFCAAVCECSAQASSGFDGTWVLRLNGQNIIKLTLATEHGRVTGWLTKPGKIDLDGDGGVGAITADQVTLPVQKSKSKPGRLELRIGGDGYVMTLTGQNRASLAWEGPGPFHLERAAEGSTVVLATSLAEPPYPEEIRALREHLRTMVKEDQEARMPVDPARMEAVDARNRPEVLHIFDQYGWVTRSLAGKDAAHNYWLLIQHQTPEIQRRFLPELERAAKAGEASMSDYAYLYDRVQVGLGKPQHWGSQFTCKGRKPVLDPVDDRAGLDVRRHELSMPPIRAYLKFASHADLCRQAR